MKTTVHIALILLVGVGLGLLVRTLRPKDDAGPGPDEVVFTNSDPDDDTPIENPDPVRPDPNREKPPGWMQRFELTQRDGKTVTSDELLGQPYVVSFFFTTCPSTCVQQNQKLKELQDQFADQGVKFLSISCDPETDTPDVLREYAARFQADQDQWLFMTGDLTYIRRVGTEMYELAVDQKFHTEKFVLVDSKGDIEGYYLWPEPKQFEQLQEKIGEMLEAGSE